MFPIINPITGVLLDYPWLMLQIVGLYGLGLVAVAFTILVAYRLANR